MMISQQLINLVEQSEGYSATPYKDTNGKPTIGYGFTHYPSGRIVTMDDAPIDRAHADDILEQLLEQFIKGVNALVPDCNQNQKDALIDFAYNEGLGNLKSSTMLKTILINPNDGNIRLQFSRWMYDEGGHKEPGLVARRAREAELYFTPVENA